MGIGACFAWTFTTAFIMFKLISITVGLRVSPEEELEGLDFVEHGGNAYPDFEVSSYGGMSPGDVAVKTGRQESMGKLGSLEPATE